MHPRRWQRLHLLKFVSPEFLVRTIVERFPPKTKEFREKKCAIVAGIDAGTVQDSERLLSQLKFGPFLNNYSPWQTCTVAMLEYALGTLGVRLKHR